MTDLVNSEVDAHVWDQHDGNLDEETRNKQEKDIRQRVPGCWLPVNRATVDECKTFNSKASCKPLNGTYFYLMPGPSWTNSPQPNIGGLETTKEYIQRMKITNPVPGIFKLHVDWHIFSALSSAKKARVVSETIPDTESASIIYYLCKPLS